MKSKINGKNGEKLLFKLLRLRIGQQIINERYKKGDFKPPIHLAFGHEAVALAVSEAMTANDQLILSHRNIHYNLARSSSLKKEIDEYLLSPDGLGGGQLGSMNLACAEHGVPYTSSILGNNLPVSAGFALAQNQKKQDGVLFVVTGDGAMEEGSFYESIVFMKTFKLPVVIVVEDNGWSLATRIPERRSNIDVAGMATALGATSCSVAGNDIHACVELFAVAREEARKTVGPVVVTTSVTTFGYWTMVNDDHPKGKFINYHAGPAKTISIDDGPIIEKNDEDPLYRLECEIGTTHFAGVSERVRTALEEELS